MNPWRPVPAVRLLLPFLAGIILGRYILPAEKSLVVSLIPVALLITCVYFLQGIFYSYRYRWVFGLLVHICLMQCGLCFAAKEQRKRGPELPAPFVQGKTIALCEIHDPVSLTRKGFKTILRIRCYREGDHFIGADHLLLAYMNNPAEWILPKQGDLVLIRGRPERIRDQSNPASFNYAGYLAHKGVFWQISLPAGDWKCLGNKKYNSLSHFASILHDKLLALLRKTNLEIREFAVIAALLLGYTREIDGELKKGYSAAGATHILSVSGMHVGVVYLFLEVMLAFLKRRKSGEWSKCFLLVVSIWFYALLTGLSPPVMRAAAMLSLIIIGKTFRRKPEAMNIVATSAFILLAFNPSLLWDIGFQFSYLAVAGLVVFYKPLYDCYVTSAYIPDKIWSVMAASLAAQLTTFPIALYYFHQFPNYFLLTNIVVVPLSALIIYTGIITIAFCALPPVALLLGKVLGWQVWFLNSFILFVEKLPWSLTSGAFVPLFLVFVFYFLMISAYRWIVLKKRVWFWCLMTSLVMIPASVAVTHYLRLKVNRFVVYNIKNVSAYDFLTSGHNYLFRDYRAVLSYPPVNPVFVNHWGSLGIRKNHFLYLFPDSNHIRQYPSVYVRTNGDDNYIQFLTFRIIVLDGRRAIPQKELNGIRVVVLRNNCKRTLQEITKAFHPEFIVADGSNRFYRTEEWRREALASGINFHAVCNQGAFVLELNDNDLSEVSPTPGK